MLLSIILLLQSGEVVVRTSEPRPANPWQETFSARCGRNRLEIERPMRPLDQPAAIRLNGRAPRGDLAPLAAEFAEVGAAYRLSFSCSQNDTVQLRWVRGLSGRSGVRYRAGSAEFAGGALIRSTAEDTTEETFWYR
ncbi:MAG: hypothetical protein ACT6RD_06335 [Brevundimonas sp.]|uniref:hypothetical protein n=1 Tax=Brevundimonas sp. TaxID=1871086 RepID=UPI004033E30A